MAPAIGIDLGTVYSCVAVHISGNFEIIPNDQGNRVTPSMVAFTGTERLVGDAAKNQLCGNPSNTVYDAKRLIGLKWKQEMEYDTKRWPFKVINEKGKPKFQFTHKNKAECMSPEKISAMILIELKTIAEKFLNEVVTDAVITVPAHFSDSQRQATKDAAEMAGLNVLQLLNEPTAAAIAYGLNAKLQEDTNILVFDLGGGTFDVSILVTDGELFDVKAVNGHAHLGGEDFNNRILDYFVKEIEQQHGVDISCDKFAINRLLIECELAKIALSTATVADVKVNSLFNGEDFSSSITRACFEDLNADFFDDAIKIVEQTIQDANLTKDDIQEVVLVGGSTYIPKVQKMLQKCFNGKNLNKSVKPDEAVAFGAAAHASVLSGDETGSFDLVILDVTRFSLGLEVGRLFHKIIDRNSKIPLNVTSSRFSTARDNQTTVAIKVYEGERKFAIDNSLLGRFLLTNLPKAGARQLKIKVTFEVDVDGILKVHAVETSSGIENQISIDVYKDGLNVNVEEKLLEAKKFEAEDEAKIKEIKRLQLEKANNIKLNRNRGVSHYQSRDFDEAFENFTKMLRSDEKNVYAMGKRAHIHFIKGEYDDCLIECMEALKLKESDDIKQLLTDTKKKIPVNEDWFVVLNVSENATKKEVTESFKKLAKIFSPNARRNAKLIKVDRIKVEKKMAKINGAKKMFENNNRK